jgi:hypothetical protein
MDPNATLARIRELCREIPLDAPDEAAELAELVGSLDEWITRGGYLPAVWQVGRPAALAQAQAHYPADRPIGRNPRPVF